MYQSKSIIIKYFESYSSALLLLLILLIVLLLIYCSNYLRICYYLSKLHGPPAYPIIGNANLVFGSLEDIAGMLMDTIPKYSPMFRAWLGPVPIIFVIDPEIIQKVLTHSLEKAWFVKKFGADLIGDAILVSKVSKWKYNRSLIIRGFSSVILKSYFKVFLEKDIKLVETLNSKLNSKDSFDIFDYISKTTMDSICGSTMGVDIDVHNDGKSYFNAIQSGFHLAYDRGFRLWKHLDILYNLTKDSKKLKENKRIICGLTNKIISEKRTAQRNNNFAKDKNNEKNCSQKPLLDYLIDITENNTKFTDEHLRDEINLIIIAGYETTANALSFVLLSLAAHKDIQQKVYDELCEVLGSDPNRMIELDDLPKLTYMEMVIKETLRLYTTVPLILRQPTSDIKIGDYLIPKGCSCIIPIICLHRDEKFWDNPLKFDPERFTPENIKTRHPNAYIPFSNGPRNCIGVKYSMMFMKTLLPILLSRYEFHTNLKMNELKFKFELSLKLVDGHQVLITPRNVKHDK